ncbi:MAG TPA: 3-dehydroquinate synthase [Polyangiaceae bacterium]|jgi:3-dehydroquinate synthase|nr:3-dehydroquinate synthase [Polyangiaceae bacterium]
MSGVLPSAATESIRVEIGQHRYDVIVRTGAVVEVGAQLAELVPASRVAVLADGAVANTLLPRLRAGLGAAGFEVLVRCVPGGEERKTLATAAELYGWLASQRLERGEPVIALGGGVLGDCAGFVAATYARGLPLVHCPTTLLAMTDSAIGGKVAVNLPQGKNLVGAFHQPVLVASDLDALATLPDREFRCGLAECVIHAVLADPALFEWMEANSARLIERQPGAVCHLVLQNVRIKAGIVAADEREAGQRALLNLGHTFGHAIETTTGYRRYLHGEAVALGLVAAAELALARGWLAQHELQRIRGLLSRLGLSTEAAALPSNELLIVAMRSDKKVRRGAIQLVLPEAIGTARICSDAAPEEIACAWNALRSGDGEHQSSSVFCRMRDMR